MTTPDPHADAQTNPGEDSNAPLRKVVLVCYALQAAGFLTGGLGNLVAVVIAYIKRDDAQGTLLADHLRWQINTFWGIFILGLICFVLSLLTLGLGAPLFFGALTVWLIYRIAKGWLAFNEGKSPYPPAA